MTRYSSRAAFLASGRKPVFVLHCMKTAGTSLIAYLTRLHGRSRINLHYDGCQSAHNILESLAQPGERGNHRMTHLPGGFIAPHMEAIGAGQFHWMACVREPVARQASLFRYLRNRRHRPGLQNLAFDFTSLEAFVDGSPRNSQCRHFHPSGRAEPTIAFLDRLSAQVMPSRFVDLAVAEIYAQHGLPPLAPVRANRTGTASGEDDISPAARQLIQDRFAEDRQLFDICEERVAPLLREMGPSRLAIDTLDANLTARDLAGASEGGSLHIFGSSAVAEAVLERLLAAGMKPSGFIDSGRRGELRGLPIRKPDDLPPADWADATVLIAAEAYGPVWRLLADRGCGHIVDAFDYGIQRDNWTN